MNKILLCTGISLMLTSHAFASDATDTSFANGKQLFQSNCLSCHNAQLDPPQAPPMFAVQMKYKMVTKDKDAFVEKVTSFATHPTEEKAIIKMAVKKLGVMPELGFEESDVRKIAGYIHDETFSPPCKHWKSVLDKEVKDGDQQHYNKVKKRYKMMCSSEPKQANQSKVKVISHTPRTDAEEGTLKAVMQQLGKDFTALNQAILLEDFDTVAQAAGNIANHDKPSMFQKMKILTGLRTDMAAFKKKDEKVHNLALEMEEAAKAKDMKTLIAKQSLMMGACMACHTGFRTQIIEILK